MGDGRVKYMVTQNKKQTLSPNEVQETSSLECHRIFTPLLYGVNSLDTLTPPTVPERHNCGQTPMSECVEGYRESREEKGKERSGLLAEAAAVE